MTNNNESFDRFTIIPGITPTGHPVTLRLDRLTGDTCLLDTGVDYYWRPVVNEADLDDETDDETDDEDA